MLCSGDQLRFSCFLDWTKHLGLLIHFIKRVPLERQNCLFPGTDATSLSHWTTQETMVGAVGLAELSSWPAPSTLPKSPRTNYLTLPCLVSISQLEAVTGTLLSHTNTVTAAGRGRRSKLASVLCLEQVRAIALCADPAPNPLPPSATPCN